MTEDLTINRLNPIRVILPNIVRRQAPQHEIASSSTLAEVTRAAFSDPSVYQVQYYRKKEHYGNCDENTRRLIERARDAGCDIDGMRVVFVWSMRDDHHFLVIPHDQLREEEKIPAPDAKDIRRWSHHTFLTEERDGQINAYDLSTPPTALGQTLGIHLEKLLSWELEYPDALTDIYCASMPAKEFLDRRDEHISLAEQPTKVRLGEIVTKPT